MEMALRRGLAFFLKNDDIVCVDVTEREFGTQMDNSYRQSLMNMGDVPPYVQL